MLDTPSTVAASICLLARWRSGKDGAVSPVATSAVGMRHQGECGWCAWATPDLLAMVEEHNRADDQGDLSRRFRALPPVAQRALVDEAQGIEQTAVMA